MKECEDFASDIAFEAADDLSFAHALLGAALHIRDGSLIVAEPNHNHAMKSGVGLAVASTVKPMPRGLAGGSRQRTDSAESGEGGLRPKPFGIAPCGDQKGCCGVRPYAKGIDEGWRYLPGESSEFLLQVPDLRSELTVAARKRPKSVLSRCGGVV